MQKRKEFSKINQNKSPFKGAEILFYVLFTRAPRINGLVSI